MWAKCRRVQHRPCQRHPLAPLAPPHLGDPSPREGRWVPPLQVDPRGPAGRYQPRQRRAHRRRLPRAVQRGAREVGVASWPHLARSCPQTSLMRRRRGNRSQRPVRASASRLGAGQRVLDRVASRSGLRLRVPALEASARTAVRQATAPLVASQPPATVKSGLQDGPDPTRHRGMVFPALSPTSPPGPQELASSRCPFQLPLTALLVVAVALRLMVLRSLPFQ